jgi:hypothetical protein
MGGRRWTEAELAELKRLLDEGLTNPEIARRLGRTEGAVKGMASAQGWRNWHSRGGIDRA